MALMSPNPISTSPDAMRLIASCSLSPGSNDAGSTTVTSSPSALKNPLSIANRNGAEVPSIFQSSKKRIGVCACAPLAKAAARKTIKPDRPKGRIERNILAAVGAKLMTNSRLLLQRSLPVPGCRIAERAKTMPLSRASASRRRPSPRSIASDCLNPVPSPLRSRIRNNGCT